MEEEEEEEKQEINKIINLIKKKKKIGKALLFSFAFLSFSSGHVSTHYWSVLPQLRFGPGLFLTWRTSAVASLPPPRPTVRRGRMTWPRGDAVTRAASSEGPTAT